MSGDSSGQSRSVVNLPAFYDPGNGNLTTDTTDIVGGEFIAYFFDAKGNGGFVHESHRPIMDTLFTDVNDSVIAESNFAGIPTGVYSLGNVLPVGLSKSQLVETYFGIDSFGFEGIPKYPGGHGYYALGPLSENIYYLFEPIYSPSPHVAINDISVGLSDIGRWANEVTLLYDQLTGGVASRHE